jgi:RNA polymerase sigma factor (sigma-70 family)
MPNKPEANDDELSSGTYFTRPSERPDSEDAQARWLLFRKQSRALYTYVRRMVDNRDDADELFQDVALAVLQQANRPEDIVQFAAWCRGLARHLLYRYYRTKRRRANVLTQFGLDIGDLSGHVSHDPERHALTSEALDRVFDGVDDRSRQMILDRHLFGESAEEIAERMEQSSASVRMKLMRLRSAAKRRV